VVDAVWEEGKGRWRANLFKIIIASDLILSQNAKINVWPARIRW
jgi:hypothetical protein